MLYDVTFRVKADSGLAVVTVDAGLVTRAGLKAFARASIQQVRKHDPAVLLADYRAAVFFLTSCDFNALFSHEEPTKVLPAALLVSEPYVEMFQAHSWAMAQAGIMRKVFTSEPMARRWCQMRLSLCNHQARTVP